MHRILNQKLQSLDQASSFMQVESLPSQDAQNRDGENNTSD